MEQNLRRKARYIQHEHIYAGYDSSRRKRRLDRKARVPAQADNGKTLRKLPSNTRSSLILTTYSMSVREDLKCGYGLEIIKMKQILCVLAKAEAKVGAVESMKIIWIDVKWAMSTRIRFHGDGKAQSYEGSSTFADAIRKACNQYEQITKGYTCFFPCII